MRANIKASWARFLSPREKTLIMTLNSLKGHLAYKDAPLMFDIDKNYLHADVLVRLKFLRIVDPKPYVVSLTDYGQEIYKDLSHEGKNIKTKYKITSSEKTYE